MLFDRHNDAVRDTERAADRRAGKVAAMVYNMHRDGKTDPKGKTWLDVFPEWKEPAPAQSEEAMLTNMQAWVAATARKEGRA